MNKKCIPFLLLVTAVGMADKVFSLPLTVLVTEVISALIDEDVILLPVTSALEEVSFVEVEVTSIGEDATVTLFIVVAVLTTTDVGDSMLILV